LKGNTDRTGLTYDPFITMHYPSCNDAPKILDLHAEQLSNHVCQLQRPSEDDDTKKTKQKVQVTVLLTCHTRTMGQ
jgi:hypothetical protein